MTLFVVKGLLCGKMVAHTKENGFKTNVTALASISGPMAEHTLVSMSWAGRKDMAYTAGQTVTSTKENGKTANNMAKDFSRTIKANLV